MIFDTKVAGIPCQCKVTHYRAGKSAYLSGPMEDAREAEPEEFEYEILDSKGKLAPWLSKKLTEADTERLLEEFHITVLEHKHYYDD